MKSELDKAFKGKCENCNKKNVWVRRVESTCVISSTNRGYYDICFDCLRPTIEVNTKGHRGIVNSPMKEETYQRWVKLREEERMEKITGKKKPTEPEITTPEITTESFLHFECDCGANFPMEENRINDNELLCPSCGLKYEQEKLK